MNEIKFLYISDTANVEAPLENGEGIMVIDAEGSYYVDAWISNEIHCSKIFAPEINWYLQHTQSDSEEKKNVLKNLYKIREIRHSLSAAKEHREGVDRNIVIIGDEEEALSFVQNAKRFFEVEHIAPSNLLSINGKLGNFKVVFEALKEDSEDELEQKEAMCSQIIFCDEELELTKHMGIESLYKNDSDEVIQNLRSRIGGYDYSESITFNKEACLYHHKDEPTCTKCIGVCPTFGLVHDEQKKELHFSHLDCVDCGICVSVCPTGAIDYSHFTQDAFLKVAKLSKNQKLFLIAEPDLRDLDGFEIPEGFLPIVFETNKFLSKTHLLSLVQESGASLILYAPEVETLTQEARELLNEIYKSYCNEEVIYIANNKNQLKEQFIKVKKIEGLLQEYDSKNKDLRSAVFDDRLKLISQDDWINKYMNTETIKG